MPIPAHPGSDAPVHISYVCLSPVHLLQVVSVGSILNHDVHFAGTHVSVTCVLALSLICGFRACCQSHNKLHGIPTQHYSWAKTYWLYQLVYLHLLKFLRMFNASSGCRC